jgi:hypothetical protein
VFMREDRKSFGFNISSVANQRMPTSAALILRKVESLLLRHSQCTLRIRRRRVLSSLSLSYTYGTWQTGSAFSS